jgi:hypothetical protein
MHYPRLLKTAASSIQNLLKILYRNPTKVWSKHKQPSQLWEDQEDKKMREERKCPEIAKEHVQEYVSISSFHHTRSTNHRLLLLQWRCLLTNYGTLQSHCKIIESYHTYSFTEDNPQ